jgi:KTSC domain
MAAKTYPVNSSAITQIVYDEDMMRAIVTFRKSGKTATIEGISSEEMKEWLEAPSIGRWYVDHYKF